MAIIPESDLLEVLACDIASRPPAPGPEELGPFITAVLREPDAVLLSFDPAGESVFASFAEAERRCCADIGWDIVAGPALRITGTPAQLDAVCSLFEPASE